MKYFLFILGCQYNEWDSARLRYFLDHNGLHETSEKEADLIVVIACSVRQTAIDRIFGKLNVWIPKRPKNQRNDKLMNKKVVITGCVLENDKKKLEVRGATIIEPGDFESLSQYLNNNFNVRASKFELRSPNSHYIPIMTGCNNFCSYCAVPYTRGKEMSQPLNEVTSDIKKLISAGHKQIMLLGQNVNSYAINKKSKIKSQNGNLECKSDFTALLENINDIDGDFEISFTSNHPKDLTVDIIEAVSKLPKIKKEIHLPLQSGSDKILKAMKRPYTKKQYLKIVDNIRSTDPEIEITTDAIVGFPEETNKDFEETVRVFEKVGFKQAFVNKYSPRFGTKAYDLGDPVTWSEKQHRWRVLNKIANQ